VAVRVEGYQGRHHDRLGGRAVRGRTRQQASKRFAGVRFDTLPKPCDRSGHHRLTERSLDSTHQNQFGVSLLRQTLGVRHGPVRSRGKIRWTQDRLER
jgi:hypothetical protein